MIYMLDTNVLVEMIRRPNQPVQAKVATHLGGGACISAVTYAELIYGVYKSSDQKRNRMAVTQVLAGIPILDFDRDAAECFARIFAELEKSGQRISERDMMIAGHAMSKGYILVTNNMGEFSRINGLRYEAWKTQ